MPLFVAYITKFAFHVRLISLISKIDFPKISSVVEETIKIIHVDETKLFKN